MTAIVLGAIDRTRVSRVLDLGCGTGGQTRRLARHLPHAAFTGVDISPANVVAAESARQSDPAADRMQFIAADYFALRQDPFDVIVSDGVLHLVDAHDQQVARKLASDLADNGVLVVAMATDCLYNRVFALVRRGLRGVRSPALDRLILRAGRRLYGRLMSTEMLAERVHYMYLPPTRLMGARFRAVLAANGLEHVATQPLASTSASQLTHAAFVFRRRG
jgi:trans-aconitate methyltransferase